MRRMIRDFFRINRQVFLSVGTARFYLVILFGKFSRLLFRPELPDTNCVGVNVHLGCGAANHPDFINVDGFPFPHVHFVHGINKLPMFENGTVDLIYASHCLEHFPYKQTKDVLQEWHRVLKNGGILRLSIPDFDKLVDIYKKNGNDPDVIIEQLMGGQNNKFNFHLTAMNRINLDKLLKIAGFSEIKKWYPGTTKQTTFDDFSIYKKDIGGVLYEISLNIEAIKSKP